MANHDYQKSAKQLTDNETLALVKNSPVMIASWSFLEKTKEIKFKHISQNSSQFGYTSEELVMGQLTWIDLVHPDDTLSIYETVSKAVKCDWNNYTNYFRLKNKVGEYRWVEEHTNITHSEDSNQYDFHSVFVDITERKELELQLKQKHDYFEALHETTLAITNRLNINELTHSFATRLTNIFQCKDTVILLVSQETNTLAPFATTGKYTNDKRGGVKRGEGAVGQAWEAEEALYIEDYCQYANPIKNSVFEIKAFIAIPLMVSNKVIGVMGLGFSNPQIFDSFTKEYLEKYAQLVAIAIDNAQLYTQVENDLRRNKALFEISRSVQQSSSLDTLLNEVVEQIRNAVNAKWITIYKINFENSYIEHISRSEIDTSKVSVLSFEELMTGMTGLAIRSQQVAICGKENQATEDPLDTIHPNQNSNIGSVIVAPLIYQGNVLGIIQAMNTNEGLDFTEEDANLLTAVSDQTSVALAQFNLKQRLEHQAYHDALTGLPNRVLFEEALNTTLSSAQQKNQMFAVIFLDLDGFKHVNDTLGHDIGDKLLQLVAERLQTRVRKADTLARMGGDEFAIVLGDIASKEEVFRIGESYLSLFKSAFQIENYMVPVGASIGISCYPDDAYDASSLVKHADSAMYQAKYSGKNNVCVFTPTLVIKSKERLNFEAEVILN